MGDVLMRAVVLAVLAVLAVLVGACGLDVPPNVDHDNDLVADRDDNCPGLANPDQSDFDHDHIGDACDTCDAADTTDADADDIPDACDGCIASGVDADMDDIDDACEDSCVGCGSGSCDQPTGEDIDADGVDDGCDPCRRGPQHDEDGDGIYDGCDNCPADPNPGQENTIEPSSLADAGDACDDDPRVNTSMFDPFTTADGTQYIEGSQIAIGPEDLSLTSPSPAYVMYARSKLDSPFEVRTHVEMQAGVTGFDVGLVISNALPQPAATSVACHIVEDGGADAPMLRIDVVANGKSAVTVMTTLSQKPPYDVTLVVDATNTATCIANAISTGGVSIPDTAWYGGVESAQANSHVRWYFALD